MTQIQLPVVAVLTVFLSSVPALASLCPQWLSPVKKGQLDKKIINEASGIEISSKFKHRLYHHNDSGGGAKFYITDERGGKTQTVKVNGLKATDLEDLTYGPCSSGGDTSNCLYLADIGDNLHRRRSVQIAVVREVKNFPDKVTPLTIVNVKYPDRAHNAEGFAYHPNGDFFIVTKEMGRGKKARPAQIFRLTSQQMKQRTGFAVMTKVGEINIPHLLNKTKEKNRIVTAFDIAADGKSFVLLTYDSILEVNIDLSKVSSKNKLKPTSEWVRWKDYNIITTVKLPQQEALAYGKNGRSLVYTTEFKKKFGEAPIYEMKCANLKPF